MLTLRPYQREAVDAVYRHLRNHDDNPCVVCPVGSGKSEPGYGDEPPVADSEGIPISDELPF